MKKFQVLTPFLCLTPVLAQAEVPTNPKSTLPSVEATPLVPATRNTFFQVDPLSVAIGAGVRNRLEGGLKGKEHSFRYAAGFSKDFWGVLSYKYASLFYADESPSANYSGIGFKLGLVSHYFPFVDIQYIKGWQYSSGPFKWGQLEVNALPIVLGAIGGATILSQDDFGKSVGTAILIGGVAAALSFNLAF